MEKYNLVNIKEWKEERFEKIKKEYLEDCLSVRGLEVTEDNIKLVEYDLDFSDGLKHAINESNLLSLICDGNEVVAHRLEDKKIRLHFSNGHLIEFFVDLNGNIQTSLTQY